MQIYNDILGIFSYTVFDQDDDISHDTAAQAYKNAAAALFIGFTSFYVTHDIGPTCMVGH